MADRPKGYGMTAELQDKVLSKKMCVLCVLGDIAYTLVHVVFMLQKDAKYSIGEAKEACDWIAAVTGESAPSDMDQKSVQEWLKNGVILCKSVILLGCVRCSINNYYSDVF